MSTELNLVRIQRIITCVMESDAGVNEKGVLLLLVPEPLYPPSASELLVLVPPDPLDCPACVIVNRPCYTKLK